MVLLTAAAPAAAEAPHFPEQGPPLVGLVDLPCLFVGTRPDGPPGSQPPRGCPVVVFAAPQSPSPMLVLRDGQQLVAFERRYEELAAAVYERRQGWSRLRLADGRVVWLPPKDGQSFHPLSDLLQDALVNTLGAIPLSDAPGGHPVTMTADRAPVKVLRTEGQGGRLWAEVELLDASPCDGEPIVLRRGWLPVFHPDGRPALWFAARGC